MPDIAFLHSRMARLVARLVITLEIFLLNQTVARLSLVYEI